MRAVRWGSQIWVAKTISKRVKKMKKCIQIKKPQQLHQPPKRQSLPLIRHLFSNSNLLPLPDKIKYPPQKTAVLWTIT